MKTMQKLLAGWLFTLLFQPLFAQNLMVIHQGNGTKIQLPLESIDSIRFASLPPPVKQKIFQNNGNVLSLAVTDIDSITYDLPNAQSMPQVNTEQVVALSSSSIYAQGSVQSEGSSAVTQRGFCWSLQPMPSLANNFTVTGSGTGSFGTTITPLQAGTLYYVRAYASNSSGTAYGAQLTVNTQSPSGSGSLATITTNTVQYSPDMGLTAVCGGNVTADGGLAVTARGVCWASGTTPTLNHNFTVDGFGAGSFTSNLTALQPNTQYFVRAYATNDAGTVYGVSYGFTTIGLPQLSTIAASAITSNSASSGGNITSDGGSSITTRGVCWSTSPNPTIALSTKTSDGSGSGSFYSSLTGLSPNTLYFIRAYAINSAGTSYGSQNTFTSDTGFAYYTNGEGVTDIDGNFYNSIIINGWEWMKENLRVSKYRNGDTIPNIISSSSWQYGSTGRFSLYDHNPLNNDQYGKLYNWFAVADTQGLCPTGWHVPSKEEWIELVGYLGGSSIAGGRMKSIGTIQAGTGLWNGINLYATNQSGFSGLPGGKRSYTGSFAGLENEANWWSNSKSGGSFSTQNAWMMSLSRENGYSNISVIRTNSGLSVRCLKDGDLASVSTAAVSNITSTSVTSGGVVISDGGSPVWARGVILGTSPNPSLLTGIVGCSVGTLGGGVGAFSCSVNNLEPNTLYYIRAFATNSAGTVYGNEFSFTTAFELPTLATDSASAVSFTSAISGGNIAGVGTIISRGVCWSTNQNPTIALPTKTNDGMGSGTFSSNITGLSPGTIYYVRAYATNSAGTAYGNQISLLTIKITTTTVTGITTTSAIGGGLITNDLGNSIFQKGICWSTNPNPTTALDTKTMQGPGAGSYSSNFSGLIPNTLYYVRAYATNSTETFYGNQISFNTSTIVIPIVTTINISNITPYSAVSGGNIINNGGENTSESGICWSVNPNPTVADFIATNGTGFGMFASYLSELSLNTQYYVRAYAINSAGIGYGNEVVFSTPQNYYSDGGGVTDIDGNSYNSIIINGQEWMKENLKVTKYSNGNVIDNIYYSNYNNDLVNNSIYGKLYDWYAVSDSRGLCPAGWHVPNDNEWFALEKYLDPTVEFLYNDSLGTDVGGKLKKITSLWTSPNTGATNTSGFSALPGGRFFNGSYFSLNFFGSWWTSQANLHTVSFKSSKVFNYYADPYNFSRKSSVRCLKD